MRIPFACAFIELLASYDNINHYSYLLNFFPARYKAYSVCGSLANFLQKTFPEKITQNKVCICHKLCMYGSEFFSPWALVFRKTRCLIRPRNLIRPRLQTSLTSFSLVRILLSTVSFLMRK